MRRNLLFALVATALFGPPPTPRPIVAPPPPVDPPDPPRPTPPLPGQKRVLLVNDAPRPAAATPGQPVLRPGPRMARDTQADTLAAMSAAQAKRAAKAAKREANDAKARANNPTLKS